MTRFLHHPAVVIPAIVVGILGWIMALAPLGYYVDRWFNYWSPL